MLEAGTLRTTREYFGSIHRVDRSDPRALVLDALLKTTEDLLITEEDIWEG